MPLWPRCSADKAVPIDSTSFSQLEVIERMTLLGNEAGTWI